MYKQALKNLKEYKLNLFILLFASTYSMLVDLILTYSFNHSIAVILSIVVLFLMGTINKFLFIIIYTISTIINTTLLHVYIHWGDIKGLSARIEVSLLSPVTERMEYLKSIPNFQDIICILYLLIGILILIKLIKTSYEFKKLKKTVIISLGLVVSILYFINVYDKIMPYKLIFDFNKIKTTLSLSSNRKNYLNENYKNIISTKNSNYDHIIVIIGESANKNHLSTYGYHRNTTPFLDSLNGLKIFQAISPTNQTRYSIPCNLTDATPLNFNKFFSSHSIISQLKKDGFETHWLSNQFRKGRHESYITSIADEADFVYKQNLDYGVNDKVSFDEVLIDKLKQIINPNKKQVFFIHIMGSHVRYLDRYPAKYSIFKDSDIVSKYDNTIYYTDYVLSKIYSNLENNSNKFLYVYFSDHGEVVSNKKYSHGFLPSYKDEYQIPFVMYSSFENKALNTLIQYNKLNIIQLSNLNKILYGIINEDIACDSLSKDSNKVISVMTEHVVDYNKLKEYDEKKVLSTKEWLIQQFWFLK